jgi:hypothetical protein
MIDLSNADNRGHFAGGVYYADMADAEIQRPRALERDACTQARVADRVVRHLGGASFASAEELQDFACARAVESRRRCLSPSAHARLLWAARDVWFAHAPTVRYEITERGRAALRNTVAV